MASPFASLIRRPLLTARPLSLCLGLSTAVLLSQRLLHPRPVYCDSPSPITRLSSSVSENAHTYTRDAQVPIFLDGWRLNPAAYRQISAGSILGLVGGVAVSMFSRTLAIVFGLTVLGVQYLASKGVNVIPTTRLQRYVQGIDLRSAIEDNAAFKLSFGTTFALASLAEF